VKVVAVDYGSARTGVAFSDPTGTLARPVGVIERAGTEAGLERLVEVIKAAAAEVGGGGGGRATMARAGGKDPAKLDAALERAEEALRAALA